MTRLSVLFLDSKRRKEYLDFTMCFSFYNNYFLILQFIYFKYFLKIGFVNLIYDYRMILQLYLTV